MPDFVDEILDAFLLCIVSSGFFTRRISAVPLTFFKQVTPHSSENAGVRRRKQNRQFHTTFAGY